MCPDFTGLEAFENKTLVYFDPVNDGYYKNDLRDLVWSVEHGCNVAFEDAYVDEKSMQFLGVPDTEEYNYALRRNTALCIRKNAFVNDPDILRSAFLGPAFGTIIPHPFAKNNSSDLPPELPILPLAKLSYMIVIDKDYDDVSESEKQNAIQMLRQKFAEIDRLDFWNAAHLAACWSAARSDPRMLSSDEAEN